MLQLSSQPLVGRRMSRPWRSTAGAYLAAWCVLCSPWLIGGLTIPYDAKAHLHAQLLFLAHAIHTGQSPFWTPNIFGGSPQIADPQSLIFSPALLIALFNGEPSFTTVDAYVFAMLGFGGFAVLMFFKDRGWHPAGGLVAALGFAFGASAAWRVQHIGQIESFASFGITLWLVGRLTDKPSVTRGVAAGLGGALMIVEPDQVAMLSCYVIAGFVAAELLSARDRWQRAWQLAPAVTAAAVTCACVVAVPLLLTFLFVSGSTRAEIPFDVAAHGSLHPASLLTAVVGDLFGALDPNVPYWGPYSYSWDHFDQTLTENMGQVYVGALPIMLFLTLGLCRGLAWGRDIRFFTMALVVMTIYALGAFTPVFRLLYAFVPGVHLFRRPADATFLMGGLMAIVAGYLTSRVANSGAMPLKAGHWRLEGGVLALPFAACLAVAAHQGHLYDSIKPILMAAVCLTMSAAAFACLAAGGRRPQLTVAAIGALMTCDLAINNGPNHSTASPLSNYDMLDPNTKNETVAFLKQHLKPEPHSTRRDRIELVGLGFEWPNAGLVHGFEHVLGYNPLRLEAVEEGLGAGETIAVWQQRHFSPLFPSYRSRMADMMGLRYIASSVPIDQIDKQLKPGDLKFVRKTAQAYIYENPRALPRIMVASNWLAADFDRLIRSGAWPDFDPTRTVLLETPPPIPLPIGRQVNLLEPGFATIEKYENTVVAVDVTASRQVFVVRNCMWHPWWRATIDGIPVPVLKANVLFQAVEVPAGRHRVEFTFEPLVGAWDQLNGEPDDRHNPPSPGTTAGNLPALEQPAT